MSEKFKISENASCEEIRQVLSRFGRFSELDIKIEGNQKNGERYVVFSEIGISKRLRRFIFEDKKTVESSRKQSQRHLQDLAVNRPDISKLLGLSVLKNKFWTASDLYEKLKIRTTAVQSDRYTGKFEIKNDADLRRGVTDAKLSEVEADTYIHWNISDISSENIIAVQKSDEKSSVTVSCNFNPDETNLRGAYRAALSNATGHVVLSPVVDVPMPEVKDNYPYYAEAGILEVRSDKNLRILLEEIDLALQKNKAITRVTIARGDVQDDRFLSRVLAQRAILDRENESANQRAEENPAAMPESFRRFGQTDSAALSIKAEVDDSASLDPTYLPRVHLCCSDPGTLKADTTFLSFQSVDRCATALAKAGLNEFRQVRDLVFDDSSLVREEAEKIMTKTEKQWGIQVLEIPPGEMPCLRLYAMQPGSANSITFDLAKIFFVEQLKRLKGRVVIEIPANLLVRKALWASLNEINHRLEAGQLECVLATPDADDVKRFYQEGIDEAPGNGDKSSGLYIDDVQGESFNFFDKLQGNRRR